MKPSSMGYYRRKYARFGIPTPFNQYWVNRGFHGSRPSSFVIMKCRIRGLL